MTLPSETAQEPNSIRVANCARVPFCLSWVWARFGICCLSLLILSVGCDKKPAPLKEGVITRVTWSTEPNSTTGYYRGKMPDKPLPGQGGLYGVDMYGVLYPTCLEVQFIGGQNPHSQIIPLNQIIWLEFGDDGIVLNKH